MGLFEGRLTFNLDIYKKLTDDLLLYRPVALSTGFSTVIDNVGSVENKGLELGYYFYEDTEIIFELGLSCELSSYESQSN